MPSASAFESSCPQTRWTWIRQTLIEAALLSSAIKLHRLPSPVWTVWISSSLSRQASHSPPRRSRPILSRMILKVVGDQFIDETSPSLSGAAKVSEIVIPCTPPTRKPTLGPFDTHHIKAMLFASRPSHLLVLEIIICTEGRQCSSQVAESHESIVQPQGGTPESMYDWSIDEIEFEEYLPSSIGYYGRKTLIDGSTLPKFTVPAMLTDFSIVCRRILPQTGEEEVLPAGWTKHTHSDGKPYFYHDHDKIITGEWLYDRDIAEKVARYISILKDAISKRSELFGRVKSWHLYVEIAEYEWPGRRDDNLFLCRYYFVNHDAECIFWLSNCRLDGYLSELRGKMSPDLIRNVTMSKTSTVTRSIDTLKIMSKSIILAESKTSHSINSVANNGALISELDASEVAGKPTAYMMALLRDQILDYHGQRDTQTAWDDSVYGYDHNKRERTVPFRIAKLLLFYAPIEHYTSLNKLWVDRLVFKGQQAAVVEQIIYKLNLSNGMATVLLAVNMAFLAVPSVDDMGAHQQLSVTKILICFSVVVNLGSIIIGLFLIGHHTALKHADIITVTNDLERHWQRNLGFERLAIVTAFLRRF
ncbi:hypothetical protein ARMSODRAFT_968701 [Armillaria solidipes]|uniref:WW domain-containing protein n=1 Tax=Armillaria solidipes TaxID=1076256 RepID=A0A2H3C6B0_9AGAR|nr:hypothetical protein ARMSODRAFT_968701 [Armillaria solidipes]